MKYCLFFLILFPLGISAQSIDNWVIGSGGESSVNSRIQISWTLGEPNTATINKNGHMFTEGFQQSYLEVIELNLFQSPLNKLKIQVFPNPTSDHIQVDFGDKLPRDFDLRLFDSKGKLLQFQQYENASEVSINLEGLAASVYLISIQINEEVPSLPHSFQIIKQ
jgi:hypothetical protein